jgi:hypothetical protein
VSSWFWRLRRGSKVTLRDPWTKDRVVRVKRLIRDLYRVVQELEDEFVDENRKFTPDGHLVGSIGEVVAAYSFGLTLYPSSAKTHDAKSKDGRKVQIKLTGGNKSVALSSKPDYLIVLQLREYKFGVVYNGPGAEVWVKCTGDPDIPGQRQISLTKLRELQALTKPADMIPQQRDLPDISDGS